MSAPALPDLAEAANGASYQQIKHWQLPTRPTKVKGNNHATDWAIDRRSSWTPFRRASCAPWSNAA
jgi:hypothetical protein